MYKHYAVYAEKIQFVKDMSLIFILMLFYNQKNKR